MRLRWLLLIATISLTCCTPISLENKKMGGNAKKFMVLKNRLIIKEGRFEKIFSKCAREGEICFYDGSSYIIFPEYCPKSIVNFYVDDERFEFIGYAHGVVTVKPKISDNIMFSYSEKMGVLVIYWDYNKSESFVDRGEGLGVDRPLADNFAFYYDGQNTPFSCK